MSERKKFTPGPWTACEDGLIDKMVVGGNYELIIDITHHDGKRNDADAFLIATAPKMYKKLEELKDLFRWGQIQNEPFITNQREAAAIEDILKEARGEK